MQGVVFLFFRMPAHHGPVGHGSNPSVPRAMLRAHLHEYRQASSVSQPLFAASVLRISVGHAHKGSNRLARNAGTTEVVFQQAVELMNLSRDAGQPMGF